jgi:Mg2+ and Co2+ transporter CorA
LIYLLVSCLWEENLRYLDKEIKRISFREIRNPKLEINSELHDRREDLAHIKAGLIEAAMYIPTEVKEYFATHPLWTSSSRIRIDNWKRLIEEATKLEAFLMETFKLFMSSVSVQDSRLSIEQSSLGIDQARRGSQLTFLAFIYVPLSFVTGIFGMNIQQINGSGLNIWVCFVALVPVIFVTVLVFLAVKLYGSRKGARKKLAYYTEV